MPALPTHRRLAEKVREQEKVKLQFGNLYPYLLGTNLATIFGKAGISDCK